MLWSCLDSCLHYLQLREAQAYEPQLHFTNQHEELPNLCFPLHLYDVLLLCLSELSVYDLRDGDRVHREELDTSSYVSISDSVDTLHHSSSNLIAYVLLASAYLVPRI